MLSLVIGKLVLFMTHKFSLINKNKKALINRDYIMTSILLVLVCVILNNNVHVY